MSHKRRYDSLLARKLRAIHTWAYYAHTLWTLQNSLNDTEELLVYIHEASEAALTWVAQQKETERS